MARCVNSVTCIGGCIMRRRNNDKFCITMILGVIAIFLVSCHNANASVFTSSTKDNVLTGYKTHNTLSLSSDSSKEPVNIEKASDIKINQEADLGMKFRAFAVASK